MTGRRIGVPSSYCSVPLFQEIDHQDRPPSSAHLFALAMEVPYNYFVHSSQLVYYLGTAMRTGGSYDVIIMIARIGKQCLVWASLTFSYETFDIGRDSLWNLGVAGLDCGRREERRRGH